MEKKYYFINGGEHKVAKNIAIKVARAVKRYDAKGLSRSCWCFKANYKCYRKGRI